VTSLLIGRGGLLGSAMARHLGLPSGRTGVDWSNTRSARETLVETIRQHRARSADVPRSVMWCAGTGFVGATPADLAAESELLRVLLDELRPFAVSTTITLASSAGAIHAGGPNPASERSAPTPISRYGDEKLAQEALVAEWCREHGGRAAVARMSNLYGPGQNLAKPQGLISRLVRASLLDAPLTIFVPLETTRDYLYVDDAATTLADLGHALSSLPSGTVLTKIVASLRLTTVGSIVAELGRIRKKRPPVVFATTAATGIQPRALSFRSVVLPELDARPRTTIPAGLARVLRDQLAAVGAGRLR